MRLALAVCFVVGCGSCDSAVESVPPPTEPTQVPEAEPEAPEPDSPAETTTGFIEATIDGHALRFEHLLADDNQVMRRATTIAGHDGPEREHGLRITLTGIDVRDETFPAVFRRDVQAAIRGDLAAATRMAAINYQDASGDQYGHIFSGEELRCESFEEMVLKCSFEGTLNARRGGSVAITDGRFEVLLTNDPATDIAIEGTAGAAEQGRETTRQAIEGIRQKVRGMRAP